MKALISPNEKPIYYISEWVINTRLQQLTGKYIPIYSEYPNSCRIAQVESDANIFPVAAPLFWANCPENCEADKWWYDTVANTCQPIVNAPMPTN